MENTSGMKSQIMDARNISLRLTNLNALNFLEMRGGKVLESVGAAILAVDKVLAELELIDLECMVKEAREEIQRQIKRENSLTEQINQKRKL